MESSEAQPVPVLSVQVMQRVEEFLGSSQGTAGFDRAAKNAAVDTLGVLYDALHEKYALKWPEWLARDDVGEHERDEALLVFGALLHAIPTATTTRHITRNPELPLRVLSEHWPLEAREAPLFARSVQARAFASNELHGVGGIPSKTLLTTLSAYEHDYRHGQTAYHSPYTALVGPSGIGKSFTVKQLAVQQGVFVVYASLGDPRGAAFPTRSPIAQTIQQLQTLAAAETFWHRYAAVASDLVHCAMDAAMTPGQLFCLLADACFVDTQGQIAALVGDAYWSSSDETSAPATGVAMAKETSADRRLRAHQRENENQHNRRTVLSSVLRNERVVPILCDERVVAVGRAHDARAPFFVLVVDEAMPLLSMSPSASTQPYSDVGNDDAPFRFRGFRRGLAAFHQQANIGDAHHTLMPFGLVLATSSRMSNFLPTAIHDPSAKHARAIQLFRPIHKLPTWDMLTHNTPVLKSFLAHLAPTNTPYPSIQVDLEQEAAMWQYLQYTAGRPLWGAMYAVLLDQRYDDNALHAASDKVLRLAETKLFDASLLDDASMLALLSIRISFDVHEKRLAETLSSRLMHFIVHVSDDRTILHITQPSEPILVRAAMGKMQDRNVRSLVVHAFWKLFSQGAINAGDMGERVAALLLLLAADVDSLRCRTPATVSLQSWLNALVYPMHPGWVDDDVRIHLTHVSRLCVRDRLSPSLLQTAFLMGQGWFLEKNCPGADLLVPCWNKKTKQMSAMLVQVKNRQVPHHITPLLVQTASADLARAKAHLPFLHNVLVYGLYLNLRPPDQHGQDGQQTQNDHDDHAYVRWCPPDTVRKLQVGIVVGFSRYRFPVLDEDGLPHLDPHVERAGPRSIESALAAILSWSVTGVVYENDEDVRSLLWTRDATSLTG